MHYYDVGQHMRIDVKTCVDFNVSNGRRRFDEHLGLMESRCIYEHGGSAVVCLAVTASGGLGPAAISLLAELSIASEQRFGELWCCSVIPQSLGTMNCACLTQPNSILAL